MMPTGSHPSVPVPFLLAHGGLLNYRNATTHWTQVERFSRSYPLVRVVPDALFVQDGCKRQL